MLARARLLLFASRDVWFIVGLPVYLYTKLGWSFWQVGGFLAIWVIGYGVVQALGARASSSAAGTRSRAAAPRSGWRSCSPPSRPGSRSRCAPEPTRRSRSSSG